MDVEPQKYYLYIDDSGSRFPNRQDHDSRRDGMDHFALGGVLLKDEDKDQVQQSYLSFCGNWSIDYPLHSTKIRGMRGDFIWLEGSSKQNEKFHDELEDFLLNLPVIGFAAVIHRPGYNSRYKDKYDGRPWWMCKTAYAILIERAVKFVRDQGGVLEVRFEEAGKREDRAIIEYAKKLKQEGMPFNQDSSKKYGVLMAEDFQSLVIGEPRRRKKDNLYLQIADLYLYPMAKRGYDSTYNPWVKLYKAEKVIDALIPEEQWGNLGIKYSCFGV